MHEQELKILRQLSAYSLPDNPSQHGWTPQQIKAKFYEGLEYLFNLFYKITDATNEKAEELGETMQTFQVQLTNILEGTVSVGKAIKDGEGQEISKTYIKLVDLLNGTVAALKYISEDGNAKNIKDLEREIKTFIETHSQFMADTFDGFVALRAKKAETAVADQEGNPIHNTYVKKSNVVDDLYQTSTEKPLSANQGRILKQLIDGINNIIKSDDISLDTIREIVEYIKTNKNLIENITTAKISYSDIIDNLESQLSNKPLSANQGVILKRQIEEQINDLKALTDLYTVLNEKLEGKKNTIILSYNWDIDYIKMLTNVVDAYGNDISQAIRNGEYDNITLRNIDFNSNEEKINSYAYTDNYYLILIPGRYGIVSPMASKYVLINGVNSGGILEPGSVILVLEKDVPDRWLVGYADGFYALESRKVDLSNYVEKTTEINKVYGTSSVGAPYTYSVTDSAVANTIVKRDTTGSAKLKNLHLTGSISDGSQSFSVNDFVELKNALGIWVPVGAPVSTTITSARGKQWNCQYQNFVNTLTQKAKTEYTLYSLTEETATAESISFSILGSTKTIGASYVTDTIGYANLPKPIEGDTYWTLDSFTFDEASDVGNQCTPLPFRGSGGFETRILVIDDTPPASITFKKVIANVTLYQK